MNLNTEQYFATVPQVDVPRSTFDRSFTHKMTMNTDYLYPIFIDEALPGDTMQVDFEVYGFLFNPLVVPIMDELYFETLWFKADNRLLWNNWEKFCGQQDNPGDSTDFVIPEIETDKLVEGSYVINNVFTCGELADCFGIPPYIKRAYIDSLPFRMYNRVYNEWFRDENLINSVVLELGDTDDADNYQLLKSAKIHDYFTSCLPFSQKGDPVTMPVTVASSGNFLFNITDGTNSAKGYLTSPVTPTGTPSVLFKSTDAPSSTILNNPAMTYASGLEATGINIEDFRFAMKLQRKREMDALGGTRYIEWVKTHFGVNSSDARFHRTQFLGMTREMIDVNTVIQTNSDASSPLGTKAANMVISHHGSGFYTSFEEHGYIMGLARIRHNPIYQQGLHKMWKRHTLLDFYLPVFAGLGEQPVYNYELYIQGLTARDSDTNKYIDSMTFGFNEYGAEYRFKPSYVSGLLRSKGVNQLLYDNKLKPIDFYHLAENFSALPLLNQSFIESDVPLKRAESVQYNPDDEATDTPLNYPDFVMDFRFNYTCTRCMPVRNIPDGLGSSRF